MAFKDFFIVSEKKDSDTPPVENNTFPPLGTIQPSSAASFPSLGTQPQQTTGFPSYNSAPVSAPLETNLYLNDIIKIYDDKFTKLNQPGYDFFEYYKSINAVGVDVPSAYIMALQMAQAQDNTVSKDSLISQSDYYVTELEKVHQMISNDGNNKINEINGKKAEETKTLSDDINALKTQFEQIQEQLQIKQTLLNEIDGKYQPKITEIMGKLSANDTAKLMMVSNILKVKNNIQINIK